MLERLLRIKPFSLREGRWGPCPDCDPPGSGIGRMWGGADGLQEADPCWPCDGTGRRFVTTEELARGV